MKKHLNCHSANLSLHSFVFPFLLASGLVQGATSVISEKHVKWIIAGAFIVLWLLGILIFNKYIFAKAYKFVKKTVWKFDDILLESAQWPLLIIFFALGLFISLEIAPIAADTTKTINLSIKILGIIAFFIFLNNFLLNLIRYYRTSKTIIASSYGIFKTIIHIFVYGIALLIILDTLHISITPIIASLGIGSIAVALALQDTLANLFSGIAILTDRPLVVGDYVKINDEIQGFVISVGWRTTRLESIDSITVVIPNLYISKNMILNYNKPTNSSWLKIKIGVAYESDLEQVERVAIDVAKTNFYDSDKQLFTQYPPFVRFESFSNSSIDFQVYIRVKNFLEYQRIRHEYIKKLHARFNKEGIVIPFPITTVYFANKPKSVDKEITNE